MVLSVGLSFRPCHHTSACRGGGEEFKDALTTSRFLKQQPHHTPRRGGGVSLKCGIFGTFLRPRSQKGGIFGPAGSYDATTLASKSQEAHMPCGHFCGHFGHFFGCLVGSSVRINRTLQTVTSSVLTLQGSEINPISRAMTAALVRSEAPSLALMRWTWFFAGWCLCPAPWRSAGWRDPWQRA
jgi:hypothetical protein